MPRRVWPLFEAPALVVLLLGCGNSVENRVPSTGGAGGGAGVGGADVAGGDGGSGPAGSSGGGQGGAGGDAGAGASAGGAPAGRDGGSGTASASAMGGSAGDGMAAGMGGIAAGGAGGAAGGAGGGASGSGGAETSGGTSGAGGAAGSGAGAGGSPDGATYVPDPSWACGMPDGIPAPEQGELLFRATLDLASIHDVGVTPFGHRRLLDIEGGALEGERLDATFLEGGIDFELTLANGAEELEQVGLLRASNGALVYVRSCGVAPAGAESVRVVFDFEIATSNALAWLNTGKFVGTRVVDEQAKTLTLTAYDVTDVTPAEPRVTLTDPTGVEHQPWDCNTVTGTRGASVFAEAVGIGSSLSVGNGKRGNRNVIPITGGTVSGRVTGKVVPGGADYQLLSGTTTLDARYSLETDDGEYIVVRNCGPFGKLVPTFEARSDGPYDFLNSNDYVSSDPGSAAGGVSITFYETN